MNKKFKELNDTNFLNTLWTYEAIIDENQGEFLDCCNLLCMYFYCLDFGFNSTNKIPVKNSSTASDKAINLINIAEEKFGKHDELEYWKNQIQFYGFGIGELGEWSLIGNSLVPFVVTAMNCQTKENIEKVRELKSELKFLKSSYRKNYLIGKTNDILFMNKNTISS